MRQFALFGVVLFCAAIAFVWILARPSGELIFTTDSRAAANAKNLEEPLRSIFAKALTQLDDARKYHRTLSLANGSQQYDVDIVLPKPPPPNSQSLDDFLDANIVVDGESDAIGYSFNFHVVNILVASYDLFGWRDRYVVLRDVAESACPDGGSEDCYRLVVEYHHPSTPRSGEFVGTEETLAGDIAALVVRGAVTEFDTAWRREHRQAASAPPYLTASNTPETMRALRLAARGIDVLQQGKASGECDTQQDCLERAEAALVSSLELDKDRNAIAALGAALIEFNEALIEAQEDAPSIMVEQHLMRAEAYMTKARQSDFVRAQFGSNHLETFTLLKLETELVEAATLGTLRRFMCAMADYRRGRWEGCYEKLTALADASGSERLPKPLLQYANAAIDDAKIQSELEEDVSDTFTELAEEVLNGDTSARRQLVFFKHGCKHLQADQRSDFEKALPQLEPRFPPLLLNQIRLVAVSCWPEQRVPSLETIDYIRKFREEMDDDVSARQLDLDLSAALVRQGKVDAAIPYLMSAIELPWSFEAIKNRAELHALVENPKIYQLLVEALSSNRALGPFDDLEFCGARGG